MMGLKIDAVSDFASLIWLPTGISLAFLLLYGYRFWPAISLGAFLANTLNQAPPLAALGISIGNTLEALVAVYLLKKFVGFKVSLDRLKDVGGLIIFAALLSTAISASIGVLSLLLSKTIALQATGSTWLAWWVGDMISNLVVAPFLLVWSKAANYKLKPQQFYEIILIGILLVVLTWIVFSNPLGIRIEKTPISYLLFPPLIWIAMRFSQREMVTAIIVLSLLATSSTIQGMGPFARPILSESLIFLQSFMTVTTITFLVLTALVSERRRYEKLNDELLSTISHELKTPITSIKGFTQLLLTKFKKKKDLQSVQYLERMDAQLNKLNNMIANLLDLSRVEDQKLPIQKHSVSLSKLIEEAVANMQATTSNQRIIIKGNLRKKVFIDEVRIEQVLANLLSNAIKYSPESKIITVTVKSRKGKAIVGVKDQGMGIPEKYHAQLFKRYFRAPTKKDAHQGGFGIGLYLSREIVQRHGGELWVESKTGEGSVFYFSLPLK